MANREHSKKSVTCRVEIVFRIPVNEAPAKHLDRESRNEEGGGLSHGPRDIKLSLTVLN